MALPSPNPVPDEAAVLDIVNTFLSCIKKRDKALMLSLILPAGGATLLRRGKPLHMSLEGVVNRLPFEPNYRTVLDEQSYNSKVLVDGDIAMAWTPYVFYEDEVLHHTGTNIFTLLKQEHNGKWVISGVADVAREVAAPPTESNEKPVATVARADI